MVDAEAARLLRDARAGLVPVLVVGSQLDKGANGKPGFGRMAERLVKVEDVLVAPSGPFPAQVASPFQVGHDGLDGALGDPAGDGNHPQPCAGVTCDSQQHPCVTGQEGPSPLWMIHRSAALAVLTRRTCGQTYRKHTSLIVQDPRAVCCRTPRKSPAEPSASPQMSPTKQHRQPGRHLRDVGSTIRTGLGPGAVGADRRPGGATPAVQPRRRCRCVSRDRARIPQETAWPRSSVCGWGARAVCASTPITQCHRRARRQSHL